MHEHGLSFFQIFPLALVIGLYLAYLMAAFRQHHFGKPWPKRRVLFFSIGSLLLGIALLPRLHHFSMHDIRGHMIQHLLIGMLAPIGLALGAPMTLLLKTLPKTLSRLIARFLHRPFMQTLSHPVTALSLNIGGMFVLYLTPLYVLSLSHWPIHILVHVHFLLAGYLFAWSIAGSDPTPYRSSFGVRLGVLFIAIATHGVLSKYMYAHALPAGTPHPPEQIREAAKLMYYGGDFSELLLVIALFVGLQGRLRRSGQLNRVLNQFRPSHLTMAGNNHLYRERKQ